MLYPDCHYCRDRLRRSERRSDSPRRLSRTGLCLTGSDTRLTTKSGTTLRGETGEEPSSRSERTPSPWSSGHSTEAREPDVVAFGLNRTSNYPNRHGASSPWLYLFFFDICYIYLIVTFLLLIIIQLKFTQCKTSRTCLKMTTSLLTRDRPSKRRSCATSPFSSKISKKTTIRKMALSSNRHQSCLDSKRPTKMTRVCRDDRKYSWRHTVALTTSATASTWQGFWPTTDSV